MGGIEEGWEREGRCGRRQGRCTVGQETEHRCVAVGDGELGEVTKSHRFQEGKNLPGPNKDDIR